MGRIKKMRESKSYENKRRHVGWKQMSGTIGLSHWGQVHF